MVVQILLPKLGFSMEEGKLVSWLVADGTHVEQGAPLFELESDKSTQEVEASATGRLKIIADADQVYPVGTLLGEIS